MSRPGILPLLILLLSPMDQLCPTPPSPGGFSSSRPGPPEHEALVTGERELLGFHDLPKGWNKARVQGHRAAPHWRGVPCPQHSSAQGGGAPRCEGPTCMGTAGLLTRGPAGPRGSAPPASLQPSPGNCPTPRRGCARPGAPFPPSCRAKGHRAGQGGGNCALSQQQESKQEWEAESNKPQVRAAPIKLVPAEVGWGGDLLRPSLWRSKAEPWSPIPINSQPV